MCSCDCVLYWISIMFQTCCLEEQEVQRRQDQDQGQPYEPPPAYSEIERK